MTRAVVIAAVLSLACSPRARIVGGMAFVGGIGVGLPLAHECTPEEPGDCGTSRYAAFIAGGAAVGALIGLWVQREWRLQQREVHEQPIATVARPAIVDQPEVVSADAPTHRLSDPRLGGYAEGHGDIVVCIAAQRGVTAALEARCAHEHMKGIDQHTVQASACSCRHDDGRNVDVCEVLADASCAGPGEAFHVVGFSSMERGDEALATVLAEADARKTCEARGGTAGVLTTTCRCEHARCGCITDAACSPS